MATSHIFSSSVGLGTHSVTSLEKDWTTKMFWKRNMDEPKWKTREQKERRWWSCSTRVGKQERNDHFFCPVWLRFGVDKSHWRKSNELWIWGQTLQISLSFLITVYSCLAVFCLGQFYCHMSAVESLRSLETFRRNVSTACFNTSGEYRRSLEESIWDLGMLVVRKKRWFLPNRANLFM